MVDRLQSDISLKFGRIGHKIFNGVKVMIDTIKVPSEALKSATLLKVITPDQMNSQRMMILLHGKLDPEWSTEQLELFIQELALEELCNEFNMMIVIPLMQNCYYISSQNYDCDRFVAQELPDMVMKKYGISDSAERILAGVSMGGFGAVLIGARTAAFRKIISISGAYIAHDVQIGNPEVWGSLTPVSKNLSASFLRHFLPLENLEESVDRNALAALLLFQNYNAIVVAACGTKDWLYSRNLRFVRELEKNNIDYKFYSLEDGDHESECFKMGLWKVIEHLTDK